MSVDEFFNAWNGKGADFDGWYGDQCVDLFNFFNRDVIGAPFIPTPTTGGAADLWNDFAQTAAPKFYDKIANSDSFVPQKGDVMIWAANTSVTGAAGHVGICTGEGDTNSFVSFDQNYPTGSKCHFQRHNYAGVYGVLRPKALETNPEDEPMDANQETAAYQIVLGRNPEHAVPDGRTAMQFIYDAKGELDNQRAAQAQQVADLNTQLQAAQAAATPAPAAVVTPPATDLPDPVPAAKVDSLSATPSNNSPQLTTPNVTPAQHSLVNTALGQFGYGLLSTLLASVVTWLGTQHPDNGLLAASVGLLINGIHLLVNTLDPRVKNS